jgi:3-dehydroquinate synthase
MLTIKSYSKEYSLHFLEDINNIKFEMVDKIIICDSNIYRLYPNLFQEVPILIDAVEENKTVEQCLKICEQLVLKKINKYSKVIVFGGGIIQDISGFACNILFRGIDWTFVPTTLLAQTDSCIGSKTSINFLNYKNIIGTFYPPSKIIISFDFLKTLSKHDYISGVGEIIKLCIIGGEESLNLFEQNIEGIINKDYKTLEILIKKCLSIKKEYLEIDEFDKNQRQILNYGHTFGHALESVTSYKIPHGIAVIYGIKIVNDISTQLNVLNVENNTKISKILDILIDSSNIDKSIYNNINVKDLLNYTKLDKKNKNSEELTLILLNDDYSMSKTQVPLNKLFI